MKNQNVLALDLASNTGWAIKDREGNITHGSNNSAPRDKADRKQRWLNFRSWLHQMVSTNQIHVILFEEIESFAPMKRKDGSVFMQATTMLMYGGYRALLEHYCMVANIELIGFPVGTIKKHWTGKGNAKKDDMLRTTLQRGFTVENHDESDAIAILSLGLSAENISIGVKL